MNLSPPKAPKLAYNTVHKTRWEKEKIAAGGDDAVFDKANDPKKIGNWIMGETVGKGASGRVKIARHVTTNELAAVKILPISSVDKQRISVEREIVMMKLMDHPNVLRLYDIWEGQEDLYLIFEFVEGGELFDYIVNHGRLDPVEAACWFKQIISGLAYTHSLSVSHRDLKPENLLIASLNPPRLKIADWGMAAFAPPAFSLHTSCGSPHYASPQIVNGEPYDGPSTDIWSCGVILFALLTGRLPFDDKSVRILLNKVRSGKYEIPSYVLEEGRDLIRRMLVVNVADRITMAEILDHPFMQIPTPGVTMVAPPSFHELAQPIPAHIVSPTDIDSDTMHSLRLIWRDNADDDSLRLQLISPERNLAKAFYWLLERYRERRLEQYGMDEDFNPSWSFGDGVTKPYQLVMPTPMAESSSPLTSSVPDDPPTLSTALPTSSMSSALAAFDRVGRYDGDGYSVKQRNRISKYKPVRDSVHGLGISAPVTSFLPPVQEAEQPKTPVPSSSVQELAKPKAVLGSSNVHRQESPFQASPASVAQVKHDVPKPVVTRRITFDLSEKENRGKHQSFSENVKPLERRTSVAVHNRAMKHRSGPVENVMEPMFERDTQVNVRRGHSRRLTTGGSVRARRM
ncbi:Pkinase-domain-containing protein [Sistotremastrum niveocremeum HHB9708]|uniref:Pkinase-domain-containing protein n=1 Tax=Sistotremastrum niveocremeum HHB9708 TaxID=1314777 RepID=A0A164Q2E9_9AGAM|nr:Pkinase-domain-containing protein [Sistotremastrum niveocremeum HHB9708]